MICCPFHFVQATAKCVGGVSDRKKKLLLKLQISYSISAQNTEGKPFWEKREEIGKILRELCEWKCVSIIKVEICQTEHIC